MRARVRPHGARGVCKYAKAKCQSQPFRAFFFFFFVPSHLAGGGAIAGAGSGAISAPFRVERKVFILSCADRQQSGKRSNTSTRRTKEPGEGKGGWAGKWQMGNGWGWGPVANVKL